MRDARPDAQISLRLPHALIERLDAEAEGRGTTRSQAIRRLLEAALDARGAGERAAPWDRIGESVGRYRLDRDDLGAGHREHLRDLVHDRRS